jgi:DNA-binding CsgD family transcriptional regulator
MTDTTARDRDIVAYYRAGHTLKETGVRFGITKQRTHQILERDDPMAVATLRATRAAARDTLRAAARDMRRAARAGRDRDIVAYYKAGHSTLETGVRFGVDASTVGAILHRDCPDAVRTMSAAVRQHYRNAARTLHRQTR